MKSFLHTLSFPYSLLLAISFLLAVFCIHRYAHGNSITRALSNIKTSRLLLAIGAAMLIIEGTWSIPIHQSPYFAVYIAVVMASLELVCLDRVKGIKSAPTKNSGFLLNHLGMLIILWAAFFGAPDVSKSRMLVYEGTTENRAYTQDRMVTQLPFDVKLEKFHVDYYEDGTTPRQFTSSLIIGGERVETSVNDPYTYKGYTIYQDGYDSANGKYTILQIVRDPWHRVVYIGMLLLAIGSVMLLFGRWKVKIILPVTLVLTLLFTALTVAKINFSMLMPALRSWWFVPHLFIYMVAYSLMAMGLVVRKHSELLIRSASALLIIGMLTGSVWARQAWGDYWAWDPKENWAAVTWFMTLMYLHLPNKKTLKAFTIILLAFLALQITWYGVNYLPSAADSMHAYK